MRGIATFLMAVALLPVGLVSCRAEDSEPRVLAVEDEIHVYQVAFPIADLGFWNAKIGQEVFPGLILQTLRVVQTCEDHVHALMTLKPPAPEEPEEQEREEPEPQQQRQRSTAREGQRSFA